MEIQARSMVLLILLLGVSIFIVPDRSKEISFLQVSVDSFPPVNNQASLKTQELLKLLYYLKGKYVLAGQHNYLEEPEAGTRRVEDMTGQTPALQGFELGAILNQSPRKIKKQRQQVVEAAIRTNHAGGIVAITYHAQIPGECACWEHVNNGGISEEKFKEIITPGTELNEKLLADLDSVATYLKQLQNADVPVLWRPYHEMNGYWFWWGQQAEFAKLWEIMYDRFTHVHKLNNLLWVWSPNAPNSYAEPFEPYYVGSLRADILAVDVYHGEFDQPHHDRLGVLGGGKPISIGENGELPDPELLSTSQQQYTWFMTWADELEESNDLPSILRLYNSERILTLDKLKAVLKEVSRMRE